ncbi:MAG: valine--tRNA ligase [Bacteroidales bacterium]|jgi:valyl-tRNA synthetase|nr:valine--tRNA ligase [Bacteroidales bacterium]
MTIATKFNPAEIESQWYKHWMEKKYFNSKPDNREPYTVVIPPPNVTGILHMGHMLNNTIQDILVRRARMMGYNACWVPGTDHASIATEAKVVEKLRDEGIDKQSLTREEFLEHAWEWKEKHGGIILEQLKKLGASCDWERTKFTMDKDLSDSVIKVFVDMYNKGLVYRGIRMVNWDPKANTALSDEEVIHKEVQSKLYYLNYKIEGEDGHITIATTRPETILGDTAICVNPNDDRFASYKGKNAIVPLIGRTIPIIFDDYVDMEFGTGALKITPAHDVNDYNLGLKHKLEVVDIFNPDGTLNESAQLYVGKDRFVVRKEIVEELRQKGFLQKEEDYVNKVGFSERTDEVIEPKISLQWFLNMQELSKPALEVVMDNTVAFYPEKFKSTYAHWMENIKDWCISRQLWWGHRIPAYYLPNKEYIVAETKEEALKIAQEKFPELDLQSSDLEQDEDVLDTWFSSWLWPISVFDGINNPDNEEIKYYYPTEVLVTAPEILFFWVARMIMAGLEYTKEIPFKHVYLTGIVRDKQRRKMSKSLGNSPDPIELMGIYGADGVRIGMLLSSPAGNDLLFDEALCEQGRNFSNKIWNAMRLVKGWQVDENLPQPLYAQTSIEWFESHLNKTLIDINEAFDKYRLSDALMMLYKLIWDDFCSWYLEAVKPAYQQPIDAKTYKETIDFFEKLMQILHPFMPFITEEVWHTLQSKNDDESIMISSMPKPGKFDKNTITNFEIAKEIIANTRTIRQEKNIPNRDKIEIFINKHNNEFDESLNDLIIKLANAENLEFTDSNVENSASFRVGTMECFVPFSQSVNVEEEIAKIDDEIKYLEGFLKSVMGKLSNEKFVNNAPPKVVEIEMKKKADAEEKIRILTEQKNNLKA